MARSFAAVRNGVDAGFGESSGGLWRVKLSRKLEAPPPLRDAR